MPARDTCSVTLNPNPPGAISHLTITPYPLSLSPLTLNLQPLTPRSTSARLSGGGGVGDGGSSAGAASAEHV